MVESTGIVRGCVQTFPSPGGWHYVQAPKKYSTVFADIARGNRGFVPIHATCGKTTWDTSLLPKGDGTHFIALPKHVRRAENILLGDTQTIRFTLRI